MEQHPIPQQISSYQFRLVGDMTLKQFFQLAGGALVSLLFYASPLHPLIKWPFIIFFALLGVALAFLPFEERPLEKWIIAFFRSIYSPTLFYWRQAKEIPSFFREEVPAPAENVIAPGGEGALKTYLSTTPPRSPFFAKLEDTEKAFLNQMTLLFGAGGPPSGQISVPGQILGQTPLVEPTKVPEKPELFIPPDQAIGVPSRPRLVVEEKPSGAPPPDIKLSGVTPVVGSLGTLPGREAQFSLEASPPMPPTTPNTVVGQILDERGKIIEGAILEIRDAAGRPVRALKSNKLGHFIIVTSLQDGRYQIITEKDGFSFDPVFFEAKGEIIPPIAILGKIQTRAVVEQMPTQVLTN